jgi:hypothetical protein
MRTVITLTDVQGRRTEIWQDCDTIGIGDAQFALTGFGDVLAARGRALRAATPPGPCIARIHGDDCITPDCTCTCHEGED